MLSRAKSKLVAAPTKPTQETSLDTRAYLENYMAVSKSGDMQSLEKMLAQGIAVSTDGGGKIRIVREFTQGRQAAAGLLFYVYTNYLQQYTIRFSVVNHQPAILFYNNGILANCQVFDIDPVTGKITHIYSMVDPDKLKNIDGENSLSRLGLSACFYSLLIIHNSPLINPLTTGHSSYRNRTLRE